jgi:hypothetical protein
MKVMTGSFCCTPAQAICLFILLAFSVPGFSQAAAHGPGPLPQSKHLIVVTVRQPDTLVTGEVLFNDKVDTAGHLKYLLVTEESGDYYARPLPDLATVLETPAPYRDWLVWVHGDGKTFNISLERAFEIQALHQVNLIVFSWPTLASGLGPIANFKNSQKNAHLTTPLLHDFFHELDHYRQSEYNRFQNGHLSIFFHSLGCYLLEESLNYGYLQDVSSELFSNLIINAAAVPSEDHAEWIDRLNVQQRVYITYNDGDINLAGLRVISELGYQLGERPLPPLSDNAVYLDFTRSVGFRFPTGATHSYYYSTMALKSASIKETFNILLHGYPLRFADDTRFRMKEGLPVVEVLSED